MAPSAAVMARYVTICSLSNETAANSGNVQPTCMRPARFPG